METNNTELVSLAHEIGRRLQSPNIDAKHSHCPRIYLYRGNPPGPLDSACYLTLRQEGDRYEVSGNFHFPKVEYGSLTTSYMPPSGQSEHTYRSITISAAKSVDQIASEIKRRFLPGYLSAWDDCAKRMAQTLAFDEQCRRTKEALAQVCGDTIAEHQRSGSEVTFFTKNGNGETVRLVCRVSGNKSSLNIDSAQPVETIARLIEILKSL